MTDHEYETPVDVPADELFAYVAEPAHLPEFLTVVSEAHTTAPDRVHVEADVEGHHIDTDAWFRPDPATRTLRWGATDDYGGELTIREEGPNRSHLTVRLHTSHGDDTEVQRELVGAVAALAQGAAAQNDANQR